MDSALDGQPDFLSGRCPSETSCLGPLDKLEIGSNWKCVHIQRHRDHLSFPFVKYYLESTSYPKHRDKTMNEMEMLAAPMAIIF